MTFPVRSRLGEEAPSSEERAALEQLEGEQQRIAQALHDTLCQELTGILLLAQVIGRHAQRVSPEIAGEISELGGLLSDASSSVHALVWSLRSSILSEDDLIPALHRMAVEMSTRCPCAFECAAAPSLPDAFTALQLYRIAEAGVRGALERPGVSRVLISLRGEGQQTTLSVQAEGNEDAPLRLPVDWALSNRRARTIGAQLTLESAGFGTLLSCSLTFPADDFA